MKTLSMISVAAVLAASLSAPVWAGPAGMARSAPEAQASASRTQVNPELIANLQEASRQALREGTNGNRNNAAFGQMSAQINDLMERLKSGQNVDPAEIDRAFQPAQVC